MKIICNRGKIFRNTISRKRKITIKIIWKTAFNITLQITITLCSTFNSRPLHNWFPERRRANELMTVSPLHAAYPDWFRFRNRLARQPPPGTQPFWIEMERRLLQPLSVSLYICYLLIIAPAALQRSWDACRSPSTSHSPSKEFNVL